MLNYYGYTHKKLKKINPCKCNFYLTPVKSNTFVRDSWEPLMLEKYNAAPATVGPHGGTWTLPPATVSHNTKLLMFMQY